MNSVLTFEVCVESAEGALAAQQGGADRVELCDNLLEGGTTPSAGSIASARRWIRIGLQVMIRPRGGDFLYSEREFEVMRYDVEEAKRLGADGVVFGMLLPDGTVDRERTAALTELARPLNVTFHRAFDMTRDPFEALEALQDLGVDRILTSGGESSALEGLDCIAGLVREAGEEVVIMAGGGIHPGNVAKIVEVAGVREIHFAAAASLESPMRYRNNRCYMGGALRPPEFARSATNADAVRETLRSASVRNDRR